MLTCAQFCRAVCSASSPNAPLFSLHLVVLILIIILARDPWPVLRGIGLKSFSVIDTAADAEEILTVLHTLSIQQQQLNTTHKEVSDSIPVTNHTLLHCEREKGDLI